MNNTTAQQGIEELSPEDGVIEEIDIEELKPETFEPGEFEKTPYQGETQERPKN